MIQRQMAKWLKMVAREYAVISIMGPRQSGKTTLAKMLFPDYGYVNLEDPDLRRAAERKGTEADEVLQCQGGGILSVWDCSRGFLFCT